jgi:hypothetical protein
MSAFDPKRTRASPRKGRFLDRPYERTVSPFTLSGSDFETGPLMLRGSLSTVGTTAVIGRKL